MKKYFNVENTSILQKTARKWLGVPYHHMGTTIGGVDCTKMLALIFVEMQLLSLVEECYYPRDWVQHGKRQVLRDAFEHHLKMYLREDLTYVLLDYKDCSVHAGDVLLMDVYRKEIYSHSSLYLGENKIIHAVERKGVHITDYGQYWRSVTGQMLRIMEK